jgi:uncharacterized membrane protein YjdF
MKFVFLRPLNLSDQIGWPNLRDFTLIVALSVLQSGNRWEFANHIVFSLKSVWHILKTVHGKLCYSQSQVSVERANQDMNEIWVTNMDAR